MKNSIDDLRNHLFDVIERLKSNGDPEASENEKIKLEDAKMICNAADCIIESIRVQNDFLGIISKAENPDKVISNIPKVLELKN